MELDRRKKWLGSVSHDERIKLTDVEDLFEDSDDEAEDEERQDRDGESGVVGGEHQEVDVDMADSDEEVRPKQKKKRRGKGMGDLTTKERETDENFFGDL